MQPLDLEAERRRIDAKLAEQRALWERFDPAAFRADLDRQVNDARQQAEKATGGAIGLQPPSLSAAC